jgi:hypothetical protein
MRYAEAVAKPGAWTLPENDIWNVPPDVDEIRFEINKPDRFPAWHAPIVGVKGLAITCDFGDFSTPENGKIFGVRTLSDVRESGYQLEGRVSIGGKKYRAFTSSRLFEREDGTLCDVAVLFVCMRNGDEQ